MSGPFDRCFDRTKLFCDMERSIVVAENQQRSDSTPLSKSSGSLIRIDTISINLAGAMDNHHEARNCEHFSIRGYAAEMRKKDITICLPFDFDGNQNKSEEQTSMLPPLHVAKFRWWRCQNCRREIGATSAAEEIGLVPDYCQSGLLSINTCPHMQSPGDAATVLSDSQQGPRLDNFEGKTTDVNTSTNVNRDVIRLSSCGYIEEKKGPENGPGNHVNQKISHPTCDVTEPNPCLIREIHADGLDALRSKSSGLGEFCEPSRTHAAADTKNLNYMGNSSAEICQMGTLTSAHGDQRIVSMACEIPKVAGRTDDGINIVKGKTTTIPSVEPEEHDNLSSESDDILAESSHRDQHHDNSSGLIRQKTQKVRLLTELLGSKRNAETDHVRADSAHSSASAGSDSVSALRGHVAVQGSVMKNVGGPKGKRKMSQDKDWKPLELICPSKQAKKAKLFKGDAKMSNLSIEIADSESEDAAAGDTLQAGVRSQWNQYRIDSNSPSSKKKNKQTRFDGGYSPLLFQQEVVPKTNQIKIVDAEKHCTDAEGGFSQSTHDTFINRGMEPYFGSSLSPQQAERKSSLFKKKNKPVGAMQACLMPQGNSVLGRPSIIRKDLHNMETEPGTSTQSLDLSLNSYVVAQRNEKRQIAQTGHGIDSLLAQRKGISREDHHLIKDIMYVGESSVSHKSAPEQLFGKGLLCDLNEKITNHRTSPLREMQNLVSRVEDRSFSQHQLLAFAGTHKSENTSDVQEQGNDDIPMEIVELMAKNQYERCHHEADRNHFFSEQTNDKRNAELMGFPRVHGNGVFRPLHEDSNCMRKPPAGMGMFTTRENMGPTKQNPINCFSDIRGDHFNMGQLEGNSAFSGFSAFSQCQEMRSGRIQRSDSSPIRNVTPQNCKWKNEKVPGRFSSTKKPVLEVYNSYQHGSQQSEEAEHARSLLIPTVSRPNHMPFGLSIPQKNETQSSNHEKYSQFPDTPRDGRRMGNLDLNFMNLNANNLENQNGNFGSESFRRTSTEYPFSCKRGGFDLNTKVSGPLDLHSNETIPAMQLLSLMDPGMQSCSSFNLNGKHKFFTKPFVPCDHHPKVSLDGTSKVLQKPLILCDHHSKFSGRGTGVVYGDSSRQTPSSFYGKNRPSEKSCAVVDVGSFASPYKNDGEFKRGADFTGQVPSKSEKQGKAIAQSQSRRKYLCKRDRCTVNRNPAEFNVQEREKYMISGKKLKFGRKIPSKGRSGLINVNGKKHQRVTKLTAMKEHPQHYTS